MISQVCRDDPIPISLVAHTVFCPRRAWLEASGETVDSAVIDYGSRAHRRVDDASQNRSEQTRSLPLHHDELGLSGRCDIVEHLAEGAVTIVEYKSTPVRRKPEVTEAQRIQLALQALCLESAGVRVNSAAVYFTNHRRRVPVDLGPTVTAEARRWVDRTREVVNSPEAPAPLVDDPRCRSCSHTSVCLPDELASTIRPHAINVSDPAGEIVHLLTPGSRASIRAGRLVVVKDDDELVTLPMERVTGLVVHGNVDVSSGLLRELLWRRLAIVWCSGRGRVIGWANTAETPNGLARVRQHSRSESGCLPLAEEFIYAKIANQATFIRRNTPCAETAQQLRAAQRLTRESGSLPGLFAIEGRAAQLYFGSWHELIKGFDASRFLSSWPGRVGRLARDPLNAALNFCYGLLLADVIRACVACGLDPHAGFLHSPSRNKPALALDLMEEFRTPVADSAVVTAINSGMLRISDFSTTLGDSRLSQRGRIVLTTTYENRISTVFKHPQFGYQLTWRRAMEVQARLVLGYLDGTTDIYRGIVTR